MHVTEKDIFETLHSFEFIPRQADGEARIEAAYDDSEKCTVFHILFPDWPGLSGSIFVVSNIDRYTGKPVPAYAKVVYERPGVGLTKRVPYMARWRQALRRAVGLGAALAREKLIAKPKVSDFPDDDTWAVAVQEADSFNKTQYERARQRFNAYEKAQPAAARFGTETGCVAAGAEEVSKWLQSA